MTDDARNYTLDISNYTFDFEKEVDDLRNSLGEKAAGISGAKYFQPFFEPEGVSRNGIKNPSLW